MRIKLDEYSQFDVDISNHIDHELHHRVSYDCDNQILEELINKLCDIWYEDYAGEDVLLYQLEGVSRAY